jgi:hypothetical protein
MKHLILLTILFIVGCGQINGDWIRREGGGRCSVWQREGYVRIVCTKEERYTFPNHGTYTIVKCSSRDAVYFYRDEPIGDHYTRKYYQAYMIQSIGFERSIPYEAYLLKKC